MVTLKNPQANIDKDGRILPVMPVHRITAKRNTKTFSAGQTSDVFITRMTDGRLSVFDASFKNTQKHYEVFTEEDLHDSFDEQKAELAPVVCE